MVQKSLKIPSRNIKMAPRYGVCLQTDFVSTCLVLLSIFTKRKNAAFMLTIPIFSRPFIYSYLINEPAELYYFLKILQI